MLFVIEKKFEMNFLVAKNDVGLDVKKSYVYYTMGHMWFQIDIQSKKQYAKQSNWVFLNQCKRPCVKCNLYKGFNPWFDYFFLLWLNPEKIIIIYVNQNMDA